MARDKEKQKITQKQWYKRNKERIRGRLLNTAKQNKANVRAWFIGFKKTRCCSRCPENNPACLHFHHRDPLAKVAEISSMVSMGLAISTIREEIAKCDVLCANCHLKLHHGA